MNWKVVFGLSMYGLAMGILTVFLIPSKVEPLLWLTIFGLSAYTIAKRCSGKYFLHGLLVGLANCVWVTGSHVLLFARYLANHPREAAMMTTMPLPHSPRLMMALVGPVIGLFAVIAAKLAGRRSAPAAPGR